MTGRRQLTGISVSPGWATGRVVRVAPAPGVDPTEYASVDPLGDEAKVADALGQVADILRQRAERTDKQAAAIMTATAQMATDKMMITAIGRHLRLGRGITRSVTDGIDDVIGLGGFLAQRATDLHDVRDRVIALLRGLPMPGIPMLSEPAIIVAQEVSAAELVRVSPDLILAIVARGGGLNDHAAIVAGQVGIPTVVQVTGAEQLIDGMRVAVDATAGTVTTHPDEEELNRQRVLLHRRAEIASSTRGPGRTKDGRRVGLLANIASFDDVLRARREQAEGVGLYRTEFLYLDRDTTPSLAEQTDHYTHLLELAQGRPVTIRTLDVGGDKPLRSLPDRQEANPALGLRGIRLMQRHPEIQEIQLQALAAAQENTGGELKVMAPMLTTVEEASWFIAQARDHGLDTVGLMLETPAAAIRAHDLLAEADFASIGTNDLAQYTMAADRMAGNLATLLDPWQPALLAMIAAALEGAAACQIPVSVCGSAAAIPLLSLVLVGLGADSISAAPWLISGVRATLARHSFDQCQDMARQALSAPTAQHARQRVYALADPSLRELL